MVQACFRQPRTQNFLRRSTMVANLFYATPSQKPRPAADNCTKTSLGKLFVLLVNLPSPSQIKQRSSFSQNFWVKFHSKAKEQLTEIFRTCCKKRNLNVVY